MFFKFLFNEAAMINELYLKSANIRLKTDIFYFFIPLYFCRSETAWLQVIASTPASAIASPNSSLKTPQQTTRIFSAFNASTKVLSAAKSALKLTPVQLRERIYSTVSAAVGKCPNFFVRSVRSSRGRSAKYSPSRKPSLS